ncbi:MAG: methyltransferase [Bacteroidetes bacterium]|jgi:tRNA1Val (adenine37-N6)-methyltransferase|nr:methyltransferase [Bacteroidota bacterium]
MDDKGQSLFYFRRFEVKQGQCAMKVGTDGVLLGAWVDCENSKYVLDIGTGTGLLALMVAQRSDAVIDAIDIDENAFLQAQENFAASQWSARLKAMRSSIQEYAEFTERKYDLIISNPPFFLNAHKSNFAQRNVARHFNESLSMVDLITAVLKLLAEEGSFSLILPLKEGGVLIDTGERMGLFLNEITRVRTKYGKDEKRMLLSFSRRRTAIKNSVLCIQTVEGKYTDEYINLTKDYYTHLPVR